MWRSGGLLSRHRGWLILAISVDIGFGVLDAFLRQGIVLGPLLLAGPLIASVRLPGVPTAMVSVFAVGLAFAGGIPNGTFLSPNHLIKCLSVMIASAFAVWVAYERSRREAVLTHVADVAQDAILRPFSTQISGVRVAARCLSATDDARIGGDLYDVANTPFGPRILVGDVRGKGLGAVRLSSATIGAFRRHAYTQPDLAALALLMDRRVHGELGNEDFVTIVLAEFSAEEVVLVNCGHPPPYLITHEIRPLESEHTEPPLGLDPIPKTQRHVLPPHSRLLFYTDGLIEGRSPDGSTFSIEAARATLAARALPHALDGLLEEVKAFTHNRLEDDLALVIAEPSIAGRPGDRSTPHDLVMGPISTP